MRRTSCGTVVALLYSGMHKQSWLSIVVPLYNEEGNVAPLVHAVQSALAGRQNWELLLVDDGSGDGTADEARRACRADPRVQLIRLVRNYGQSTAIQAGFDLARGDVVVTMDGDLQNDPGDIGPLVDKLGEGYDLVAGYRMRRKDRFVTRKVPSWVANRLIRAITGVPIRDNGCSLKAYSRELLDRLHLYSDMHRFIPALAAGTAGARIAEVPVRHHPRRRGTSKYGLSRVGKVLADLLTITMIRWFREHPLTIFAVGSSLALVMALGFGAASLVVFGSLRPEKANSLVFPGAVLLWLGLSFYLLMLGLIAEVALREAPAPDAQQLPIFREATGR